MPRRRFQDPAPRSSPSASSSPTSAAPNAWASLAGSSSGADWPKPGVSGAMQVKERPQSRINPSSSALERGLWWIINSAGPVPARR